MENTKKLEELEKEISNLNNQNRILKDAMLSLNAHLCDTVGYEEVCASLKEVSKEIRRHGYESRIGNSFWGNIYMWLLGGGKNGRQ